MRMKRKKKAYTPSASFDLGDDDSMMTQETPGIETPDSPITELPEMVGTMHFSCFVSLVNRYSKLLMS